MKGTDIQSFQYKGKISKLYNKNPDKPYLLSFVNYMECAWTTRYNYTQYAINFMNWIDNKPFEQITLDDYINYFSTIEGTSSYRIGVYSGLKQFSTFLDATKRCSENFMSNIKRPKADESIETTKKRENGYLETDEISQMLQAIKKGVGSHRAQAYQQKWKERDLAIIAIALTTGLRCSGIYKLDLDSIDLKTGRLITVEKGNKIREITLTEDTILSIKDWLDARNCLCINNESALFVSSRCTRMSTQAIAKVVKKYGSVIEGKNITPHKLRATYGTQLYAATGDIYLVQKNMNHSSPKTSELYIRGQANAADEKACAIMQNIMRIY